MENSNEDSDEIAAALAAVYAYCASEGASETLEAEKHQPSAWAQAARMESIRPCAGIISTATQARSSFFTWRNSFARRWTALCLTLFVIALLNVGPALALERIQFDPASSAAASAPADAPFAEDASNNKQLLCPIAPKMTLDKQNNQDLKKTIRIALSTNATTADIIVPDGAKLIDESNQSLLAELPPQSRWQVGIEQGVSGNRLSFKGKIGSASFSKVLLASSTRSTEPAAFTRKFSSSVKGGFVRTPHLLDMDNPKFFLSIKPAPLALPLKTSELRQVSYQSSPLSTAQIKLPTPPPVVSGYIIKPSLADGLISYAGKNYRGSILIKPRSSDPPAFHVINTLDLEEYLFSVVPSEMPSSWNLEALKAQTIAARSYALANMGKHQSEAYDLKASTEDQVYLGVQTEADSANRAVAETNGIVLKHNGKVVSAFFHSASGGSTEQAEHVWGSKLPYLKSVPDFDDQSPHFNWNRVVPVSVIEENLKKQGKDIGGLLGIFPLERSPSQRVTFAMLAGTLQTLMISGEELRKILGLPSTVFNLGIGPDSYLVAGRGFGHGLGMSQWGAKFLSEQGYNASQILSYYYKDVSVEQF